METSSYLRRRLQATVELLSVTVPVYALNVVLLAFLFEDQLGTAAWIWAALSGVTGLAWWAASRVILDRSSQLSAPAAEAILALLAAAVAGEYVWLLFTTFSGAPVPLQLILSAFTAALLSLGAVALSILPATAWAWLVVLFAGLGLTLGLDGRWTSPAALVMVASLVVVLGLVILSYHRLFLARLKAEAEASSQSELVSLLLKEFEEGARDWLWETDAHGLIRGASARFADQLGRVPADIEGRSLVAVLALDSQELTMEEEDELANLASCFSTGKPFRDLELSAAALGGHRRWRLSAKPQRNAEGVLLGWRGVGSDITEVEHLHTANARLAALDTLTDLVNRRRFQEALVDHLSPRNPTQACGLVVLDLKDFRIFNEALGHEMGDKLLRAVAQRLRRTVSGASLLARFGGDEFAVMASGADLAGLEALVSALLAAAEKPLVLASDGDEPTEVKFTLQIGAALFPADAQNPVDLLKCAELALHEAKAQPEAPVVFYNETLGQKAQKRLDLQRELRVAIAERQFELHYQPQIGVTDGKVVGAEALIRWKHPTRGMVSPADFIPVLEETALIVEAGRWILEAACAEALTWEADQKVAVNVSAVQFAHPSFLADVDRIVAASGLPPQRLELEITESVMAKDPKLVTQILQDLRARGISISLDDFGTGYSSLSYLRNLPLDKLKVDQSFVRVLGTDPSAEAIVRLVLQLSQVLNLATTAEGVETQAQADLLRTMGCSNFQGYFYSKPLRAPDFRAFCEARKSAQAGV